MLRFIYDLENSISHFHKYCILILIVFVTFFRCFFGDFNNQAFVVALFRVCKIRQNNKLGPKDSKDGLPLDWGYCI